MRKHLYLLLLLICSCSGYEGSKESVAYDSIYISFDGRSEEYYTKGLIKIAVNDSTDIYRLNELKNSSKPILFGGRKGNEYTVDLVYTDSNTGDKLLIRILKNIELQPTVIYGAGTIFDGSFRNNELVQYVASIVNLDAIREYEGELTQQKYDKLMLETGD